MFEILIFATLAILVGLAFTFMGYPFFRILLPIWGFFTGLTFGVSAMDSFVGTGFLSVSIGLVLGFFIGLIMAALAYFLYSFAVVLFGATIGFVIGQGFMLWIGFENGFFPWLAGIALGFVFAILFMAARMPRFLLILVTSLAGASAVLTGLFVLFGKLPPDTISFSMSKYLYDGSIFWFIIWILLAAFGFAVQYAATTMAESVVEPYSMEQVYVVEESTKTDKEKEKKSKKTK